MCVYVCRLEAAIRNYTTLTKGDIIRFKHSNLIYEIAICEVKPDDGRGVIGVVETDLQVDFAPPVGYEEPVTPGGSGSGSRSIASSLDTNAPSLSQSLASAKVTNGRQVASSSFTAFTGSSNKLHGKQRSTAPKTMAAMPLQPHSPQEVLLPRGTIVFPHSHDVASSSEGNDKERKVDESSSATTSRFVAFSGKSNKLK